MAKDRGHLIGSSAHPGHLVGNRYNEPDLSRGVIQRLGEHLGEVGATSITRNTIDEKHWSAAYRVNVTKGDWEAVEACLEAMADDDVLVEGIGKKRGVQVIAEYAYGKRKGPSENSEYASLSAAERPEVAFNQAASFDGGNQYYSSYVTALIFYFR